MKIYLLKQNYFIEEDMMAKPLEKVTAKTTGKPLY